MIIYNLLGVGYLIFALAVFALAHLGFDLTVEVSVAAGVAAAACGACLTDRVPAGEPISHYDVFTIGETSPPGLRVAVLVLPVAFSAAAWAVLIPIHALVDGGPVLTSPLCRAFFVGGVVNGVLFLATIPVRASTFAPPRPQRASAPVAEWGGLGHCPDCGSEGDWDGKRCGQCGHHEGPA